MLPNPALSRARFSQILGKKASGVSVTDPELSDLFHDFAFGPASVGDFDEPSRLAAITAALIGQGSIHPFIVYAGAALNAGLTPRALKEIVYEAVPFIGMTAVADFLHETNGLLRKRDIPIPLPTEPITDDTIPPVFTGTADSLLPTAGSDISLAVSAWVEKFLSRPGLSPRLRILTLVALLAGMGLFGEDMECFLQAGKNADLDKNDIRALAVQLLPFIGIPKARALLSCL